MKAIIGKYQRRLVRAWATLVVLLALTVGGAYVPLGTTSNFTLTMVIAALKAAIIIAIFMQPAKERRLGVAFSLAGIFWLILMLVIGGADYLTRPLNFTN